MPIKDILEELRKVRGEAGTEDLPRKDHLLVPIARAIARTAPLPKGRCSICGSYEERLVPIMLKICKNCARRMISNSQLRVVRKEMMEYYCDWCYGKTWNPLTVNPYLCQRCSRKMYRRAMMFGRKPPVRKVC